MKTVLVHYRVFEDSATSQIDGRWAEKSMVLEVLRLIDLNDIFDSNIIKIDILE